MSLSGIRFDGAFSFALLREITCSAASYSIGVFSSALRKGQNMYFNQVEFGQRIRELRKIQGKTQEELAAEMNVSYDHLKKIEMGLRACSLDLLVEFSTYFDVSADYLLTGKDYESIRAKVRLEAVLGELTDIVREMA